MTDALNFDKHNYVYDDDKHNQGNSLDIIKSHSFKRALSEDYGVIESSPFKYFECEHCKVILCISKRDDRCDHVYFSAFNDYEDVSYDLCNEIIIKNILK